MKYSDLLGAEIMNIREMTDAEYKEEDWLYAKHEKCKVLELDNGMNIYASKDLEGNGPGALFIHDTKGSKYHVLI